MNAPPVIHAPHRSAADAFLWVGIAAIGAGLGVLFSYDPAKYGFYPICFLHATTGLNCPGCGALRAIHQLLHGHILAAADLNLLFVLCLPFSAWWAARYAAAWIQGATAPRIHPAWYWTFLAACAVFTVLRNLPGFEWLAP
jgi:hypothetical protein